MAVRQYIGARYVPLYAGDWDATRNYEPLTIVTDANGNSFTSLKDVPAGTALTDRSFWIQTSSFSGAVDQLQRRMNDAEIRIDSAEQDIDAIEQDVSNLQSEVSNLTKRNIICIGDSYLAISEQQSETTSWGAYLRKFVGDGGNVIIKGLGGSGMIGRVPRTFQTLLSEVVTPDDSAITDIIVLGGLGDGGAMFHDGHSADELNVAIASFINYANTRFANARIHVGFCGWVATDFTDRNNFIPYILLAMSKYRFAKSFDRHNKVSYINGIEYLMPAINDSGYLSDLIHPTDYTSALIGIAISNYISSGNVDSVVFETSDFTPVQHGDRSSSITSSTVRVNPDGNLLQVQGGSIVVAMSNGHFNSGTEYVIAKSNGVPLRAIDSKPLKIPVTVALFPGKSGEFDFVEGSLFIKNGIISITLLFDAAKNPYTGITSIAISVPTAVYNLLLCA